jgi:hypothetical protein
MCTILMDARALGAGTDDRCPVGPALWVWCYTTDQTTGGRRMVTCVGGVKGGVWDADDAVVGASKRTPRYGFTTAPACSPGQCQMGKGELEFFLVLSMSTAFSGMHLTDIIFCDFSCSCCPANFNARFACVRVFDIWHRSIIESLALLRPHIL